MIPEISQTFQYGAVVTLTVQFIDPIATAANNGVPVPINISGATNLLIGLLFPDQSTSQNFSAAFVTDGTDGKVFYNTVYNTDLSQLGLFEIQGKVTLGGSPLLSAKGYFNVVSNVDNVD
jgi:hypothetical protein